VAQLDFFAVREDQLAILRFLFAETDMRIFEHCSKPDSELVEFRSAEEVAVAFGLGSDPDGNGLNAMLALWSPTVVPKLEIRRIDFDPKRVSGARFRHEPASGSLMHLYFGGLTGRTITKSHFGHHSQASARSWRLEAGADWPELSVLSRRIKYQIGSRLAVAEVPGRPILMHAAALWRQGYVLKESARSPYHWSLAGLEQDA
jgi:hypothetical protein